MHVAVCIVGFDNPGDVLRCVAALDASTHRDFELVICENGSAAMRDELVATLGDRRPGGQAVELLRYEGNSGYAGGNNRCIAARPDAQAWWILNPDAEVAADAMALLVARLAENQFDAVGATLCASDGTVQAYAGRWRPLLGRAVSVGKGTAYDRAAADETGPIDYILGAALMFTPHFLAVAGPMRDDYFLYGEEIEWCLRAKARGLRLGAEPRAMVYHAQGTTTGDGGSFSGKPRLPVYLDQRNKILVLRDTAPALLVPGAIGSLVALIARAAKHRAWRQLGYGLSGWAAGVANRRGKPDWLPR